MRIGILGSGLMGGTLGTLFAGAGHEVVFSYARSHAKLQRLARATGAKARAGTPREAADSAEVVLLAVHWSRLTDVLRQAGGLAGKLVVTCSMPMSRDDQSLAIGRTRSGAEVLARRIPKARVVSAFTTVPSEVLGSVFRQRRRARRPTLVYCGDGARGKRVVAGLIGDVGFDPLDVGPLRLARFIEPFALLMGRIAYAKASDPAVAYRIERHV